MYFRYLVSLFGLGFLALFLTGCQTQPTSFAGTDLTPVSFHDLPGWDQDQLIKALPALKRSCRCLLKKEPDTQMVTGLEIGTVADWHLFCGQLLENPPKSTSELKNILVTYLKPYRVSGNGSSTGLFTGYDEQQLRGSRRRHGPYQTPLYRLPSTKTPYKGMPRSRIVKGALRGKGLELVWVDDPIDAFFIQIQGSGRVQLDTGGVMRLGYNGTNGCGYTAIAKPLIQRGAFSKEDASRQSIKAWLKAHPNEAESVMSLNKSYVFFREVKGEGPIGAHGVPLTPQRSLAVDRRYISLGTPVWLDIDHPDAGQERIQSLVVAQDIGGAIKGAVRGDLFWGCGTSAADWAGRMKSRGEFYLLLPK